MALEIWERGGRLLEAAFFSRYSSSHGGWTTREVIGPYGISLWKHIWNEWGSFARQLHFEVGDGTKTKFWTDIWCGTWSLKAAYPELYRIARNKEAFVVEHIRYQNEAASWMLNITHPAQDWGSSNQFLLSWSCYSYIWVPPKAMG